MSTFIILFNFLGIFIIWTCDRINGTVFHKVTFPLLKVTHFLQRAFLQWPKSFINNVNVFKTVIRVIVAVSIRTLGLRNWYHLLSLLKLRHAVCQISGVSTCFQVYPPCLQVAHRNTHVNGTNFIVNCHKTRLNALKSEYSIQKCLHSLIFGKDCTKKNFFLANLTWKFAKFLWVLNSELDPGGELSV